MESFVHFLIVRKALNEVICSLKVFLISACAVVAGYRLQVTGVKDETKNRSS